MRHDDPGVDGGKGDDPTDALVLDLIEGIMALQAASAALLAALPVADRGPMRAALSDGVEARDRAWSPEVAALVETTILARTTALLAIFEQPPEPRHRFDFDAAFPCLLTCTGTDGEPRVLHLGHVGYLDTDFCGNTVVVSGSGRDAALVREPLAMIAAALKAYRDSPGAG